MPFSTSPSQLKIVSPESDIPDVLSCPQDVEVRAGIEGLIEQSRDAMNQYKLTRAFMNGDLREDYSGL